MSDTSITPNDATRVRISCPGCGRNDWVTWPPGQVTYPWKCFNCHKEFDLHKGARH